MGLKDTVYWRIFSDVWGLMKKYADARNTDDYWQAVMDESNLVYQKYAGAPQRELSKNLTLAVLVELERLCKDKEGGGGAGANENG